MENTCSPWSDVCKRSPAPLCRAVLHFLSAKATDIYMRATPKLAGTLPAAIIASKTTRNQHSETTDYAHKIMPYRGLCTVPQVGCFCAGGAASKKSEEEIVRGLANLAMTSLSLPLLTDKQIRQHTRPASRHHITMTNAAAAAGANGGGGNCGGGRTVKLSGFDQVRKERGGGRRKRGRDRKPEWWAGRRACACSCWWGVYAPVCVCVKRGGNGGGREGGRGKES